MYDLIVIGAGPGGYTAAVMAAKSGLKTAVVEAAATGGVCLNKGCIPTKYLISEMHKYENVQKSIASGAYSGGVTLDYNKVRRALEEKISSLVNGIDWLLQECKVDIFRGYAEFADGTHVRISGSGQVLEARNIIIASGSRPRRLEVSGSNYSGKKRVYTTDDLFSELDHIPDSVTIIGAGAVGLELAFVYSGFGSRVTVLEQRSTLFGDIDHDIDREIMRMLNQKNIRIVMNCTIDSIFESDDGVAVFDENEDETASSEILVFAAGRIPNTEGLELHKAHVEVLNGRISVDRNMKTSADHIYAIGDVNGIKPLAYTAAAQAENVVSLLCGDPAQKDLDTVPVCVFTDPETAYTGLTEKEAETKGIEINSSRFLMTANGRSKAEDNGGFIKIIADKHTDIILGGVCVCHGASELISYISFAVSRKMTTEEFSSVIFPHPTYSESLSEAAGLINNRCIHML